MLHSANQNWVIFHVYSYSIDFLFLREISYSKIKMMDACMYHKSVRVGLFSFKMRYHIWHLIMYHYLSLSRRVTLLRDNNVPSSSVNVQNCFGWVTEPLAIFATKFDGDADFERLLESLLEMFYFRHKAWIIFLPTF